MRSWVMALTVLWASLASALNAAEVTAHLRQTVIISSDRATLGDVADLSGDPTLIAALAPLTVIELPGLGEHRLNSRSVHQALGPGGVGRLVINGTCRVSRATLTISAETLIYEAKSTLVSGDDELQVSVVRPPSALLIPAGDPPPTLTAVPLDRAKVGDIPFVIKASRGSHELGRALLTLRVDRFRTMSVAKRIIRRGEIITDLDIATAKVAVRNGDFVIPATVIVGQAARLDIAAQTPFTQQNLQTLRSVRGGSPVTIRIQNNGFELTGSGMALADGDRGDTILVRRATDGQTITARIVGPGLVSPVSTQ